MQLWEGRCDRFALLSFVSRSPPVRERDEPEEEEEFLKKGPKLLKKLGEYQEEGEEEEVECVLCFIQRSICRIIEFMSWSISQRFT